MISPIQLTPGMDPATMAQVINDNFRQLESENRTKVIKDDEGTNRILLGRAPKGNYVLAITIKGTDVLTVLEK